MRQTARLERAIVNAQKFYAEEVEFHKDGIYIKNNEKCLRITYKYNRNKFIPFLAYLLGNMKIKHLYVHLTSKWFYYKIFETMPNKPMHFWMKNSYRLLQERPLKERLLWHYNRFKEQIMEYINWFLGKYEMQYGNFELDLSDWQLFERKEGAEMVIYDPFAKTIREACYTQGSFEINDKYEEGCLKCVSDDRISYAYRKIGSKWIHCVLLPVEHEGFLKTDRWRDCDFFNYDSEEPEEGYKFLVLEEVCEEYGLTKNEFLKMCKLKTESDDEGEQEKDEEEVANE